MTQKQIMPPGWNPIEPIKSVKHQKGTGKFVSLHKVATPIPANVLTQSFLRYAYGVSREIFRRWMGEGSEFPARIPHNKGRNIIDHLDMAEKYLNLRFLFVQYEMKMFIEKAEKEGRRVSPAEKKAQREFLKAHSLQLPQDVLDVYQKASREHIFHQGFISEAIINTLNDNNEQAFRSLDKVSLHIYISCFKLHVLLTIFFI
jgi:hypothetical protein